MCRKLFYRHCICVSVCFWTMVVFKSPGGLKANCGQVFSPSSVPWPGLLSERGLQSLSHGPPVTPLWVSRCWIPFPPPNPLPLSRSPFPPLHVCFPPWGHENIHGKKKYILTWLCIFSEINKNTHFLMSTILARILGCWITRSLNSSSILSTHADIIRAAVIDKNFTLYIAQPTDNIKNVQINHCDCTLSLSTSCEDCFYWSVH